MPRKPPKYKSLTELNPELAKEWHPTKNKNTPNDFKRENRKEKIALKIIILY